MDLSCFPKWTRLVLIQIYLANLAIYCLAAPQVQPVVGSVTDDGKRVELAPHFPGLSCESFMLLPKNGRYYFDARDTALVDTFKTPWPRACFQNPFESAEQRAVIAHGATVCKAHPHSFSHGTGRQKILAAHLPPHPGLQYLAGL